MVRRPSLHDLLPRRQELLVTHPVGQKEPRGLGSLTDPHMAHELEENSSSQNHAAYRYYTQVLAHPPHTHTHYEQRTLLSWAGNQPEIGR